MKYLFTNTEIKKDNFKSLGFDLLEKKIGIFSILVDDPREIFENELLIGITDGYIRNTNIEDGTRKTHTITAYEEIWKQWPVKENITGTFSNVILSKNTNELIICNDPIGLYPLYYLIQGKNVFISNSIILLGVVTGTDFDEVGILQRSIGQEFSNLGSRTILKNCKRLLPGEYLKLNPEGKIIERSYDNSLYQSISSPAQNHELHKEYWVDFKKEVELCLLDSNEVKVALSGGIDSRVVLGAIPESKSVQCLTFGAEDNYETSIASKLSKLKKADFQNFYQPGLYFPPVNILRKYTLETEAVQICSWLEIMENVQAQRETPMLLGELCEALPGRNIKRYSSRNFRQQNFIKYYILGKDYEFEKATAENFIAWKCKTRQHYLKWYASIRLNRMEMKITSEDLKKEVNKDLEELFSRIEAHNLPYEELYDELFSWYTYTRMRLAKQLLIANIRYKAYSPAMSIRALRNTSNIHPNLRLNYRFAKKLFREIPELRKFNKLPTSQAPLVPQNFPDLIKFPIWGIRSKVDNYLITRMMKSKNIQNRYRLFKSVDWAGAYQIPDMENNLKAYFKNNHLGEDFYKNLFSQCVQRKALNQWPFANIDIINASALNLEIDIIKTTCR